jgi:L-lactate dehydrogenase complex protein LldF
MAAAICCAGGYGEALTCIRCGACHNVCPVYREIGGQAYSPRGGGPIDSVRLPLTPAPPAPAAPARRTIKPPSRPATALPDGAFSADLTRYPPLRGAPFADLPHASTLCGACTDVCPVGIDIPRLLIRLRGDLVEAGEIGPRERLWRRVYAWGMKDAANYRRLHRLLRRGNLVRNWPRPASQTFRAAWQARRGP